MSVTLSSLYPFPSSIYLIYTDKLNTRFFVLRSFVLLNLNTLSLFLLTANLNSFFWILSLVWFFVSLFTIVHSFDYILQVPCVMLTCFPSTPSAYMSHVSRFQYPQCLHVACFSFSVPPSAYMSHVSRFQYPQCLHVACFSFSVPPVLTCRMFLVFSTPSAYMSHVSRFPPLFVGCSFLGEFYRNGAEWHPLVSPFGTMSCVRCRCRVSLTFDLNGKCPPFLKALLEMFVSPRQSLCVNIITVTSC